MSLRIFGFSLLQSRKAPQPMLVTPAVRGGGEEREARFTVE
jgi:hypothetical protein